MYKLFDSFKLHTFAYALLLSLTLPSFYAPETVTAHRNYGPILFWYLYKCNFILILTQTSTMYKVIVYTKFVKTSSHSNNNTSWLYLIELFHRIWDDRAPSSVCKLKF